MEHRMRWSADPERSLERARELAESARLIDPDIAEVHWALGLVHAQARRHEQAIGSLRRAIELNPSFADAYALMGGVHTYMGEPARSIPLLRTAMRLNPEGGYLYFLLLGRAYLFEDDYEQALINLREAVKRNPADLETHVYLAAAHAASGDLVSAQWEVEEVRGLDPAFDMQRWLANYPLEAGKPRDALAEWFGKASKKP
jgi:tetratricopeptide (TPR) repeat protein